MAKKDEEAVEKPGAVEQVRGSAVALMRNLFILALVVGLGWAAYMVFWGSDPRRQITTPEDTLRAYTEWVRPFVGPGSSRPSITQLEHFFSFIDGPSRDFFREHAQEIARRQYQFRENEFQNLSRDAIRVEALNNIINRAPLSGFGQILGREDLDDGSVRLTVMTRDNREVTVNMTTSRGLWYIADLGSVREQLEQELGIAGGNP